MRQNTPNQRVGILSSREPESIGPKLHPTKRGGGTGAPAIPPVHVGLLNTMFSMATAAASVIDREVHAAHTQRRGSRQHPDRSRRARQERGDREGHACRSESYVRANPANPAIAICASEIWPT